MVETLTDIMKGFISEEQAMRDEAPDQPTTASMVSSLRTKRTPSRVRWLKHGPSLPLSGSTSASQLKSTSVSMTS
jgi:hypothetical protein